MTTTMFDSANTATLNDPFPGTWMSNGFTYRCTTCFTQSGSLSEHVRHFGTAHA